MGVPTGGGCSSTFVAGAEMWMRRKCVPGSSDARPWLAVTWALRTLGGTANSQTRHRRTTLLTDHLTSALALPTPRS